MIMLSLPPPEEQERTLSQVIGDSPCRQAVNRGKLRRSLHQAAAKGLILLLAWGLWLGEGPRAWAQEDEAEVLNQQVMQLYQQGKYRDAIPIAEKLLVLQQRVLGPDNPDLATSLNNLAELYRVMASYGKAELLYQQALEIYRKAGRPDDANVATILNNLGLLYQEMGAYGKAESLYQQALEIYRKAGRPDDADVATILNNLGLLYQVMGAYGKAETPYQQALQISEKALGPNHPDVATSINNLAELYRAMGLYEKAEPLYQQALQIRTKALGPDHPDVATSFNNLGLLYQEMGAYEKAEPLYQQALQISEKALGPDHPDLAGSLNNLATLYLDIGHYEKAEPLLQRALRIRTRVLGPDHPDTAESLNNLAGLYYTRRAYQEAEPLLQQALQIQKKAAGSDNPSVAIALNNVAALYYATGAYEKAEPLLQEALRIRTQGLGPDHPDTATSIYNLAGVYYEKRAYDQAEPLYAQALRIRAKALGLDHPDTAQSLEGLAYLKFDRGEFPDAKALAQQGAQARLALLSKVLSFTSEQQRLAYEDTINPYLVFGSLESSDADLAMLVLRYKGVVLDSLIEDRLVAETAKGGRHRDLVERLAVDKRQLGRLLLQSPDRGASGQAKERVGELEQDVEEIQGQLAKDVAGLGRARRALTVSVEQVQAVIPETGALVEYLRYRHYLGQGHFEPRYGAIVLLKTGGPKWIPLGAATGIDLLVSSYQRLTRGALAGRNALSDNLQALCRELWVPIKQMLPPEVTRAVISPDGQLNFVSFATLLDPEGHFLAEKYLVQYVSSGRDLLREVGPLPGRAVSIFANPDFGAGSTQVAASADHVASSTPEKPTSRPETRELEGKSFPQLGGTQKECDDLTKAFKSWQWNVNALTGKDATKVALLRADSPYILHLATHGFFEPAQPNAKDSLQDTATITLGGATRAKFFENPMHRSGLALAGANVTLRGWEHGDPPALDDDGIVTAEDVAALHLNNSWLVTLSACDTGAGEAKAGEGVLGLRRGFLQAGAQNLVMSLWRVSDADATKFMSDFYERARQTSSAPEALAAVQREWLIAIRKRQGLAQAVSLAGPFIMSSQGKP